MASDLNATLEVVEYDAATVYGTAPAGGDGDGGQLLVADWAPVDRNYRPQYVDTGLQSRFYCGKSL